MILINYLEIDIEKEEVWIHILRKAKLYDIVRNESHPILSLLGLLGAIVLRQRIVKHILRVTYYRSDGLTEWEDINLDNKEGKYLQLKIPLNTVKICMEYVVYYKYSIDDYEYGIIMEREVITF